MCAARVAIRLKNVTKRFGQQIAVKDFNFDIFDEELLVLLGPSGCGKTTTLNMLAGLEEPTEGEIYFGDRLMNRVPPEERNISMVFQSATLYPHLNVKDNVTFPLKVRKTPAAVIEQRLAGVTRLLEIDRFLGRKTSELSGGERQRVAIAKALAIRPDLFLLDEPFSDLDAIRRRHLRGELVKIHRELEVTTVFVTHDQEEAMSMADRVAVMNLGKLIQVDSPLDIYFKPVNIWIARFIGAHPINIIDCEVDRASTEGLLFKRDRLRVKIGADLYKRIRKGAVSNQIILGIRPESVSVRGERTAETESEARVYLRQVLGNEIVHDLIANGHHITAVTSARQDYQVGSRVFIGFSWDDALVFEPQTEKCIINSNWN